MITQVRFARPSITLNGRDYYSELAPYLLNLQYSDNCDGQKADDLQLQLADRDRRFINDWMPDKGTFVDISIIAERWFAPNAATLSLDCGRFWIDTIDFEMPQHTVSVKASSLPTDVHLKAAQETRGWENSTLKDIAQQVAGENQMTLDWQANVNPRYERVEQTEESALQFLMHRARDAKLSIKVHRSALVFFDEEQYEAAAPSFSVVYGNEAAVGSRVYRMSGGHFTTKVIDSKKSAKVSYTNSKTGRTSKERFSAEGDEDVEDQDVDDNVSENPGADLPEPDLPPIGEEDGVGTLEEPLPDKWNAEGGDAGAQRKAKSVVREANKHKFTGTIQLSLGNPLIAAGQTFTLVGVGQYDGKWFVESAKHSVGPAYETELTVRRCLTGY